MREEKNMEGTYAKPTAPPMSMSFSTQDDFHTSRNNNNNDDELNPLLPAHPFYRVSHASVSNHDNNNDNKMADSKAIYINAASAERDQEKLLENTFWLTRIIFLRLLGLLFVFAFGIALSQNNALFGERGLTPARLYLEKVQLVHSNDVLSSSVARPTIFWYVGTSDVAILTVEVIGMFLSLVVAVTGWAHCCLVGAIWVLYLSIVNVGQLWYAEGWEQMLLEAGFLSIFMCAIWEVDHLPRYSPVPGVVVMAFRWLLFRVLLGTGLSRLRGDRCWLDLTCLDYLYETQPLPGPFSWFFHQCPSFVHSLIVITGHTVLMIVPWFLVAPRSFRIGAGIIIFGFEIGMTVGGNVAWMQWLTGLLCLWCLDDGVVVKTPLRYLAYPATEWHTTSLLERDRHRWGESAAAALALGQPKRRPWMLAGVLWLLGLCPDAGDLQSNAQVHPSPQKRRKPKQGYDDEFNETMFLQMKSGNLNGTICWVCRAAASMLLVLILVYLSLGAVQYMAVPDMFTDEDTGKLIQYESDPFHIVCVYSNDFTVVPRVRYELVIQGTQDNVTATPPSMVNWEEYQFNAQPTDVTAMPPWINPFHYRLDWLMWSAAYSLPGNSPWLIHLTAKLLAGDTQASGLFWNDPFRRSSPPLYVRTVMYTYQYANVMSTDWWVRKQKRVFLPPLSLNDEILDQMLQQLDWQLPTKEENGGEEYKRKL